MKRQEHTLNLNMRRKTHRPCLHTVLSWYFFSRGWLGR